MLLTEGTNRGYQEKSYQQRISHYIRITCCCLTLVAELSRNFTTRKNIGKLCIGYHIMLGTLDQSQHLILKIPDAMKIGGLCSNLVQATALTKDQLG